ncbi:MAG: hypothetical protein HS116_03750 [Planctomycetes bacterium]|nr:hypothetical protein [Planctomycetota bacterium]
MASVPIYLTDDGTHLYAYDFYNRLLRVTRKADSQVLAEYRYDPSSRRVRKTVTNSGSLNGTTHYVHDGAMVIEEHAVTNPGAGETLAQTARYLNGRGIDERIAMERADVADVDGDADTAEFQRFYYHTDVLNSVRAVTWLDGTTERLVERVEYDIYGKQTLTHWGADRSFGTADDVTATASLVGNPYLFTGREYDAESGLYQYRLRYYQPATGRFISQDPAGYVDGANLYGYVMGNPVGYTDPWGLCKKVAQDSIVRVKPGTSIYDVLEAMEAAAAADGDLEAQQGLRDIIDSMRKQEGRHADKVAREDGRTGGVTVTGAQHATDFARGMGDAISFGGTAYVRDKIWGEDGAVQSDTAYAGGQVAGSLVRDYLTGGVSSKAISSLCKAAQNGNKLAQYVQKGIAATSAANDGYDVGSGLNDISEGNYVDGVAKVVGGASGLRQLKNCPFCFVEGTLVLTTAGYRKIEEVEVGDRVTSTDTGEEPDSTAVDPETWVRIDLRQTEDDADYRALEMTLLRPVAYWDGLGLDVGDIERIALPEMSIRARMEVVAVGPCPPIASGPGRVVLSTFKSRATNILRLHTQDRAAPVEMTPRHRVFSVTHQGWVPADALRPDDEVKTRRGTARVAALSAVEQAVSVFNIEVERQHCYFISDAEILVHNANPCAPSSKPTGGIRRRKNGQFAKKPGPKADKPTYSDSQRRKDWKRLREDPNSPLTDAQRLEIEARGNRGPQRLNDDGEVETMELSHEPIPRRDGGTEVVPRWPPDHARVDTHRQLKKK